MMNDYLLFTSNQNVRFEVFEMKMSNFVFRIKLLLHFSNVLVIFYPSNPDIKTEGISIKCPCPSFDITTYGTALL